MQKPVITSMTFRYGPAPRKKPRAGDRRTTKKHGEQVRVPVMHNGMYVYSSGRPCFEWVSLDDPRANLYRGRTALEGS